MASVEDVTTEEIRMSSCLSLEMDMYNFRNAVKELSDGVNSAQIQWSDNKYSELKINIGRIAADSREVIMASERLMDAIASFERIV